MDYPKINSLWKREGWHDSETIRNKLRQENDGKLGFMYGQYSDKEYQFVDSWDVEEKIEGTNVHIVLKEISSGNHAVYVHGKQEKISEVPDHVKTYIKEFFTVEKLLRAFEEIGVKTYGYKQSLTQVHLFGEIIGPKIQGNYYKLPKLEFVLFDLRSSASWDSREQVRKLAQILGIRSAPFVGIKSEDDIVDYVKSFPKSSINPDITIEGVVCRGQSVKQTPDGYEEYLGYKKFKLRCEDFQ